MTGGEITPDLGSDGSGISSIGSLEMVGANLTLSGGSMMTFGIGGTRASGLFDQFTMALGSAGSGVLALGADSILDIRMVNDFVPWTGQTYQIIGASSLNFTFHTLLYNGSVLGGEYSVNYLVNGLEITLAATVPEPSTTLLLLLGRAEILVTRRCRRA